MKIDKFKRDFKKFLDDNDASEENLYTYIVKQVGIEPGNFSIGLGKGKLKFRFEDNEEGYYITTTIDKDKKFDVSVSKKF